MEDSLTKTGRLREFPNGTNGQVPLSKRRKSGGSSTVQRRRQSTASKASDNKSKESIIAAFCTWIVGHQIGKLQARIDSEHLLTLWQALL
jgi:hypothetical protein